MLKHPEFGNSRHQVVEELSLLFDLTDVFFQLMVQRNAWSLRGSKEQKGGAQTLLPVLHQFRGFVS